MNILEELYTLLTNLQVNFATGHYSGIPPDEYIVIVPLADTFDLAADNFPQMDVQEARLALYSKGNYYPLRNSLVAALQNADFSVTDRRYIEFETDTHYHHYAVDVSKHYELEV